LAGSGRIPFVKYGGIRYLEAVHVKDFICLLRIADNPADQLSWFRILRLLEGVGPVTARKALDTLDPANLGDLAHLPSRWESVAALLQAPARTAAGRSSARSPSATTSSTPARSSTSCEMRSHP
jgi:DNA helicase II / ATP-dependent DNA helicase PcrA